MGFGGEEWSIRVPESNISSGDEVVFTVYLLGPFFSFFFFFFFGGQ